MLRQLTVIDKDGKKKSIMIHPEQITFVEELTPKRCNVVVRVQNREFIYLVPKSFKDLYNFVNLSQYNLFIEN